MNQNLKIAKQHIRKYIGLHLSDQRLAEVYAFNADGKMEFVNSCCCIRGVTTPEVLHTDCRNFSHYFDTAKLDGVYEAEEGYKVIGWLTGEPVSYGDEEIRQRRFSPILRAELRRRDRIRQAARVEQAVEVTA